MTYAHNRNWANQFMPDIKRLLSSVPPDRMRMRMRFDEADFIKDTQQGTDLVVLSSRQLAIACRVREFRYYERYRHEFTIRSQSNGHRTELEKITEDHFGDFMFYGFVGPKEDGIVRWSLVDLDVFRDGVIFGGATGIEKPNYTRDGRLDGTALTAFKFSRFPESLIVAGNIDPPKRHQSMQFGLFDAGADARSLA
jgi:hypothetical protein